MSHLSRRNFLRLSTAAVGLGVLAEDLDALGDGFILHTLLGLAAEGGGFGVGIRGVGIVGFAVGAKLRGRGGVLLGH